MFTTESLEFLRDLQQNNSRDWFTAERPRYEQYVKGAAAAFSAQVEADLEQMTGRPHDGKLFRIHRDLRFSKDKTPYNTHVHLSFAPRGGGATWMVGLSPEYFTVGYGLFAFDKPDLVAFRERAVGPEGAEMEAALARLLDDGVRLDEPTLKRVPAPWPKVHPQGDLLRRKGLVGWVDGASPEAGLGASGIAATLAGFATLRPLGSVLPV